MSGTAFHVRRNTEYRLGTVPFLYQTGMEVSDKLCCCVAKCNLQTHNLHCNLLMT
jgi:hypothetical protein